MNLPVREQSDALYRAILSLRDMDECRRFFHDLCTMAELQAMSQRIDVALLLQKGMIYDEILQRTGSSSATISLVKRALQYGEGGYQAVLPRIGEA